MTYEQCTKYLRSNSILIDSHNAIKAPSKLMHVEKQKEKYNKYTTVEHVSKIFHTMALEHGYKNTYNMFNTQTFRESLNILAALWTELEPEIREKIVEARIRAKAKRGQQSSYQRPTQDKGQAYTKSPTRAQIPKQYLNVKAGNT